MEWFEELVVTQQSRFEDIWNDYEFNTSLNVDVLMTSDEAKDQSVLNVKGYI